MVSIDFVPNGAHGGTLTNVPLFPGESFHMGFPETVGDVAQPFNAIQGTATWTGSGNGAWTCHGAAPGELDYVVTVTLGFDTVDVDVAVTNRSPREWAHALAFNCFGLLAAPSVADYDCVRHWCRVGQRFRRLSQLPRRFSARPTVQVYGIAGAPRVADLPFADGFQATPDVLLEDWLAIRARDGARLVATVSRPALFLFQNREFSCIHSAQDLGALQPDQTGQATTRLYLTQDTLAGWHARMRAELGAPVGAAPV